MKLNIAIYCPYNYFRHGGVQETIAAYQEHLTKRGHNVIVVTPKPEKELLYRNGKIMYLGTSKEFDGLFNTKADISKVTKAEVKQFFKNNKFDVINIHEPGVPSVGRKIIKYSVVPTVGTFHAKLPEGIMYSLFNFFVTKPYTSWIIMQLDAYVAASDAAAEHIAKLVGKYVMVISNGIELSKYKAKVAKPQSDKKTIIYINRLEKRKGPDLLLKAFNVLRSQHQDVELIIASDGDMRQELEDYVRNNLIDDVEFIGFIEEEDKIELLKTADLYCAPSPYGEGFGIVLLEAMAAGIPYLAGDNEGYRNTSADMADELLVNPNNIDEFAKRLEVLLYDDKLRKKYKKWAKKYVKQFDYKDLAKDYEKLFKKVVKR